MWKLVCVQPWTLKMYQVEGTVSVRIFVKVNTYRLKRWNIWTTGKALNCFLNTACVKYPIVTSHYIYIFVYFYYVGKFCTDITPTNSYAKWEDYVKAWNSINSNCDQETGKEYSTTVQIFVKDDSGKVIVWRSVSCVMTCYHVPDEKTV